MKFLYALAALVGSAAAQSAFIGAPATGTSITPGTNVTVMVTRPVRLIELFTCQLPDLVSYRLLSLVQ